MINILADENMPYVSELFGDFSNITFKNGREITPQDLKDIDVLLVRSITQVNETLLAQANDLKFVGSATIGTDHIDKTALDNRNIAWSNAPGCNAIAVAQYVLSALVNLSAGQQFNLQDKTIAIVGAGNIGQKLSALCDVLSINHFWCDPILEQAGAQGDYRSMDEVIKADIISLHVPITKTGDYPTYHMFDATRLAQLKPDAILINSCRGDVIDNIALAEHMKATPQFIAVIDVWQNEPTINHELLALVDIATPHIAGYSLEGKARGTFMLYQKWCEMTGQSIDKSLTSLLPVATVNAINLENEVQFDDIKQLVRLAYDIRDDDDLIRHFGKSGKGFDNLRKQYKVRRELSALIVNAKHEADVALLAGIGFNSFKI